MIARGVDPIQVQSPVNQLAQIEQIRSAQQTNMLRQEQMAALQREREQLQTLNRLYGEAYNPTTGRVDETKLYSGLAQGGLGSQIPGLQKAELEREKTRFATSKEQSEAILKRLDVKRTQLEGVTTPDAYVNWALSGFDDPILGPALRADGSSPEKVMERINQVAQQPNALQNLIEESKLGSDEFAQLVKDRAGQQITVRGQDIQAQTTRRGQDIQEGTTRRGQITVRGQDIQAGTTRRGQDIQAGTTRRGQDITAETTRRGQDITERRERDLTFQQNLAAARATGTELAKNKVEAQAALPKAIRTAEDAIAVMDLAVGDAKISKDGKKWEVPEGKRAPAPGFESYVGMTLMPFARFAEGSPAASYERIQKQLEGQAFLSAFESLRGGGAIANAEGQQATAALFRANKAQSEVEYIKAIREAQYHARRAVEAARKKADIGEAAPATPGAPAVGAGAMNPATMSDDELRRQLGL
jgi:hypothetical protein